MTRLIHPYYERLLVTHLAGLMPVHFIKIFWLTIFALLLPSQAFASLIQSGIASENSAVTLSQQRLLLEVQPTLSAPVQLRSDSVVLEPSEAMPHPLAPESLPSEPRSPKPKSQTELLDSAVAIINSNRWSASSSPIEEFNEPNSEFFDELAHVPHYKRLLSSLYDVDSWVGDVHASEHRISGWKDSNALYVALNSQF